MKFHVLTLFPDMVMQGLMTSITGRAVQQKKIDIDAVNIRDYTQDKHGSGRLSIRRRCRDAHAGPAGI